MVRRELSEKGFSKSHHRLVSRPICVSVQGINASAYSIGVSHRLSKNEHLPSTPSANAFSSNILKQCWDQDHPT